MYFIEKLNNILIWIIIFIICLNSHSDDLKKKKQPNATFLKICSKEKTTTFTFRDKLLRYASEK